MSHQVKSMFSVKETPWHGLGEVVQQAPNAEEAINLAGLNWRVKEEPVFRVTGPQSVQEVKTHKLLIREDNEAQLGMVGKRYHVLQNEKAFEFFNPFVESGDASFETAGALREGKTVWILASLNKAPIDVGGGDIVQKFLLLSNSHDGTMAVRTGFTPIRVVCANTLAMAEGHRNTQLLRVSHYSNLSERMEEVQGVINAADASFEATAEQYRRMSKYRMTGKDLEKFVKIVFPASHIEDEDRRKMFEKTNLETITRLFETGRGSDLKAHKGTMWGAYNAVTEYLSYEKGNTQAGRLNQLWFGDGQTINIKAFTKAMEMVEA